MFWKKVDGLVPVPHETWRPAPGEGIEGVIESITIKQKTGRDGSTYTVIMIAFDDPELPAVAASQTVLKRALFELRPEVGDEFAVLYIGEHEFRPDRYVKKYRAMVTRADGTVAMFKDGAR